MPVAEDGVLDARRGVGAHPAARLRTATPLRRSEVSFPQAVTSVRPRDAKRSWTNPGAPDSRREEVKLSARNLIKGKVTRIEPGAVNSVVTLEIAGGEELVSVITISSVERLGLKVGKEAYAMIKASNVMIAVDD